MRLLCYLAMVLFKRSVFSDFNILQFAQIRNSSSIMRQSANFVTEQLLENKQQNSLYVDRFRKNSTPESANLSFRRQTNYTRLLPHMYVYVLYQNIIAKYGRVHKKISFAYRSCKKVHQTNFRLVKAYLLFTS